MATIIDAEASIIPNTIPDRFISNEVNQEAVDTVSKLIERNLELEAIFENLQPLLYALSVKLYADNDEPVTLNKLIEDGVALLKGD